MKKFLTTMLGLILIFVFVYLGWVFVTFILKIFFDSLKNLNQNQTTLLIALVPSSISILGIVVSNNFQRQKELDFKNREKKEKAYNAFMKSVFEFINQERTKKTDDQLMILVTKARKDLVLWGSDDVVKRYSEFMAISQEQPDDEKGIKNKLLNDKLEQILLAVRKDFGYKNAKFIFGDLSRFLK